MYSSTNDLAKQACEDLGFIFDVHFVKVMQRSGKIYVSATVGKPHEWRALETACNNSNGKYIFHGPSELRRY